MGWLKVASRVWQRTQECLPVEAAGGAPEGAAEIGDETVVGVGAAPRMDGDQASVMRMPRAPTDKARDRNDSRE
jgi:hypothetical protein